MKRAWSIPSTRVCCAAVYLAKHGDGPQPTHRDAFGLGVNRDYAILDVCLSAFARRRPTRADSVVPPSYSVFATKVNPIGMVIGMSHEKLQVFHRWTAWIMCTSSSHCWVFVSNPCVYIDITSLMHTFPFIVQNIRMGEMTEKWESSNYYWTGVAALVPQVGTCRQ